MRPVVAIGIVVLVVHVDQRLIDLAKLLVVLAELVVLQLVVVQLVVLQLLGVELSLGLVAVARIGKSIAVVGVEMRVPRLASRAPAGSLGGVGGRARPSGGRAGVAASSVPGSRRRVESSGTPAVPARDARTRCAGGTQMERSLASGGVTPDARSRHARSRPCGAAG